MKVLVVLSALAAVALASPGVVAPAAVAPLAYSGYAGYAGYPGYAGYGYAGYPNLGYSALGYSGFTGYTGVPTTYAAAAPVAYSAPVAHAVAAVPAVTKTQYHAQDELGQASYGYAHPGQVHNAVRDAYGNVAGSYSYVDPNGKIVKTDYIADGAGFRVASNALPVAPEVPIAPAVALPVGPAPVQDTAEVIAARAAHLAEHAKSRSKRGVVAYNAAPFAYPYSAYPYGAYSYAAPAVTAYAAHAYAAPAVAAYAAPAVAAYAAPAVRAATLTTVVNNPGHAVSYRVD
ncbi:hypothetical protein B566_EDAN012442 [Ephemera danica]|nr:hypothetical protein B566_EDAN012442 [Ephemera danica]